MSEKAKLASGVDSAPADPTPNITAASDHDHHETSKTHEHVVQGARAAAEKEHSMTLLQGIKLYPKAIFFSVLISTCIVMEGYDVCLINNFCMLPCYPVLF